MLREPEVYKNNWLFLNLTTYGSKTNLIIFVRRCRN